MDHGGYMGPIKGIERPKDVLEQVVKGGATALLIQKGILKCCCNSFLGKVGIILRVSGTNILSEDVTFETLTSTCEEALRLGADAVAFTVNVGSKRDYEAFKLFGLLVDACDEWSIPVLGEFLPAKNAVSNPYDVKHVKMVARIGAELGADIIKTHYAEPFEEVVSTCPVPIVIAGGAKKDIVSVLKMVRRAIDAGAAGICIGRNVFQHKNPYLITKILSQMVNENLSVDDALKILKEANEGGNIFEESNRIP